MEPRDYEELNLKPDASLEEVRHRYDMLMKRSLHDDTVDTEAITKAYDRIIAENTIDYFDGDAALLKEKGLNKKKLRNFLFQNRLRIGIITWILVCVLVLLYILFFQPGNISLMPDTVPF
ncbi:MAG TPA: hypothetical protein PLP30_09460 [Clostridia bacterium]|nr:hypothetical protein [Clostridia bacterium]HPQ47584.1 hypothetical protein [Clostridia bacterium]HRX43570.1 hypothetical protein [Clostridia bacterium]